MVSALVESPPEIRLAALHLVFSEAFNPFLQHFLDQGGVGAPSDPQGVWEMGIEVLSELWYTICIVDRSEHMNHVLVEGVLLNEPLQWLSLTMRILN